MAKKVLLFLSEFHPNASLSEYRCPDGEAISGSQTSDAPIRYLLRAHPDISELLCIVTPRAEGEAWENLQKVVSGAAPSARCVSLRFDADQDFEKAILPKVIEQTEAGDDIFLDTTGGLRNAVLYIILISRALGFSGRRICQAVYSSFHTKRIEDITHLFRLFDLISGMQEMTSFGSAAALRAYYRDIRHPPEINEMLDAMDQLLENITLCRTRKIGESITRFNEAIQAAGSCDDTMMRALLPAFRRKFSSKLSDIQVVRWCVQSGMLQQAMTIYIERMPAVILKNCVQETGNVYWHAKPEMLRPYEDRDVVQFTRGFLSLAKPALKDAAQEEDVYLKTLQGFDSLVKKSGYRCLVTPPRLKSICIDYLYIKQLRNMTNHANETGSPEKEALVSYLIREGHYKPLEETTVSYIRDVILQALNRLTSG